MQNNKSLSISIVILTLGIMLSSIFLGYSIQKSTNIQTKNYTIDSNVFPYFTVNEKQYFSKVAIDEWLKEASNEHREYDTNKKQLLQ